jgi:hypothetical protein
LAGDGNQPADPEIINVFQSTVHGNTVNTVSTCLAGGVHLPVNHLLFLNLYTGQGPPATPFLIRFEVFHNGAGVFSIFLYKALQDGVPAIGRFVAKYKPRTVKP